MSLFSLYNELSEYEYLKSNVGNIIYNLKKTLDPLNMAVNNINNIYLFNDKSADNNFIKSMYVELDNIINSLENTILPEINSMIREIRREIRKQERMMLSKGG